MATFGLGGLTPASITLERIDNTPTTYTVPAGRFAIIYPQRADVDLDITPPTVGATVTVDLTTTPGDRFKTSNGIVVEEGALLEVASPGAIDLLVFEYNK